MPPRFAAAILAGAVLSSLALVSPARADGDPERGHELAYTCYGCHGIANYKNVYPTYSVPKLQGQYPEYLVAALTAYKNGERAHSTMHAQATTMTDQDMQDIAAFLAGDALTFDPAVKARGQAPKKAQELCTACHGANGVGTVPQYPTIAGQHADYLQRALYDYKAGARKNAVMAGFVADLSEQDIRELARFYADQDPGLTTAEHSMWFVQKK